MPVANDALEATIRTFLRDAKTLAVVGASSKPEKEAHSVPKYMVEHGYRVIPVTPASEELFGEKAYKHLRDLPEELVKQIDGVVLFRPSDQVGEHVQAAIDLGIPVIWMQQGIRNDEWASQAEAAGRTVIQDRCIRTMHMLYGPRDGRATDA